MAAVHVKTPERGSEKELIICSAYFPGSLGAEQSPPTVVRELIAYSRRRNSNLVMGCDVNADPIAWIAPTSTRKVSPVLI